MTSPDNTIIAPFVTGIFNGVEDLDSKAWRSCAPIGISKLWSGEAALERRHAQASILWTDKALNVRFVCTQQEPLVMSANPVLNQKTIGLWDRDVCEIYVAPDPNNDSRYFEFEAAPSGEWIDLGLEITSTGRVTDWTYASGMTTTARLRGEELILGIQIPWSESIQKPRVGDHWRCNLFRCVGPESPNRYLAWQPTRTEVPNFHVPEVFGYLCFA
jgi:alpha-galactosidase